MSTQEQAPPARGILRSLGPAIITASVVLGPGSILSASQNGHTFGYDLLWILAVAGVLMVAMTALSARLGVMLDKTLLEEVSDRAGRPFAAFTGLVLFLVCACFQFSNNIGILAAVEPFYDFDQNKWVGVLLIVGMNVFIISALFGFRSLYLPLEKLMKLLVAVMTVGFLANLLLAKPNILDMLRGLIPSVPEGAGETLVPRWVPPDPEIADSKGSVADNLRPVTAMFATTFSVAGAFYQAYLVRQKGWTRNDLKQGFVDSVAGISMLVLITMMVLATAASVLHNNPSVSSLGSAADVAIQLRPAFGNWATILFCAGIFAGAFSSFLVNAMIGGTMLSDGLGFGGKIDQLGPKLCTVVALLMGMGVGVYMLLSGDRPMGLIIFAQSMTILGFPVLAAAMLWLSMQPDLTGERRIPTWMKVFAVVAVLATLTVAIRNGVGLALPFVKG